MTKQSVIDNLENWNHSKYDVNSAMSTLEENLKEKELDFSNITCMFMYNRDGYGELSIMTKPNKNIKSMIINFKN